MTQKQKNADSKPAKATRAPAKKKPAPAVSKSAPPRTRPRTIAKVVVVPESEVRQEAYFLWESRGCPIGSPEVDWYRAKEQRTPGKLS